MNPIRRSTGYQVLPLCLCLLAWAGSGWCADVADRFAKWETDIARFEASDRTNPPPKSAILFIGSSSIRMWSSLAKDFPDHKVINRGFGGSELEDSVHFAARIVFPYSPRMIVMYAGTNDINNKKKPERIFNDFKEFVEKVHAKLPDTRIAYIACSPNPARWSQVEQVRELNRMVADYTKNKPSLAFIDTFSKMLGEDGQPKPDIFISDKLHMNAKGYAIWKETVAPYLK